VYFDLQNGLFNTFRVFEVTGRPLAILQRRELKGEIPGGDSVMYEC
jgi:hypothetical protein